MKIFSRPSIPSLLPQTQHQPSQLSISPKADPPTPISQKIQLLLELDNLNPFERGFLLKIKCRESPVIWAEELEAIVAIWEIRNGCGNGGEL